MRGLVAIGAGIAGLAILAVVILAWVGRQQPTAFPPDSPEAALQGYLAAFEAADYPSAYGYFSATVRDTMSYESFESAATDYARYTPGSRRVLYDGTDGSGDAVTLRLTVEASSGGGLSTDRYSYQTQVPMVREAGGWRIDQPLVSVDLAPLPSFK